MPSVSRSVTASAGTVTANPIGTRNVSPNRIHARVDADRVLPGPVQALEQLLHLVHARRARTHDAASISQKQ